MRETIRNWPNRRPANRVPVPHPSWRQELPSQEKLSAQEFWSRLGL